MECYLTENFWSLLRPYLHYGVLNGKFKVMRGLK